MRAVSTTPRIVSLVVLALVRARRGDPDAEPPLQEALGLAEPSGELIRIAPVVAARAEVAWLAGRPDEIPGFTDPAFALAVQLNAKAMIGALGRWRRRAGLVDVVPDDVPTPEGLELAGNWTAAAAAWRRVGCPYDAALALMETGDEDALRHAHQELQRLGARPAAAIVARRLRERGARGVTRGPRATTPQSGRLTARSWRFRASRGRLAQCGDRGTALSLPANGRPPRFRDPPQAWRPNTGRGSRSAPDAPAPTLERSPQPGHDADMSTRPCCSKPPRSSSTKPSPRAQR